MAFSYDIFIKTRPFVYHLTSRQNLQLILAEKKLFSAAMILNECGEDRWIREKRSKIIAVNFRGHRIDIRDQAPLYEGKMSLEGDWSFQDLIEALNNRVFFWPGSNETPIDYGVRHFQRYASQNPKIIKIRTSELFASASPNSPEFCKYNSGSPRTTRGFGSPRGPNTFVGAANAEFSPGTVREVTFVGEINIPNRIEYSDSPYGPWDSG